MKFRKKPVVIEAVQWWPPDDPRHDVAATPIKWPGVYCLATVGCDCLDERECLDPDHRIQDGDFGAEDEPASYTPSKYWVRLNNSTAHWLRPGVWIIRGESWPVGVHAIPADIFAATYEPVVEP